MIKLGNLDIAEIYLGDYKVSKMYQGDNVIYDKSSPTPGGSSIYDLNGNLIIPAGTVCQIEDYSSEERTIIDYILPSDIVISGTDGAVTLSDGQEVRYYTSIIETQYSYDATFKHYYCDSYRKNQIRTKTYVSGSSNYFESYWYYEYHDANRYSEDTRIILPDGLFYVQDVAEGFDPYISYYKFYREGYVKEANLKSVWLHDYGEGDYFRDRIQPDSYTAYNYYFCPSFGSGKIAEDDVPIRITTSGYYTYFDVEGYNNRIPLKAGHTYCLYGIISKVPITTDPNPIKLPYYSTNSNLNYVGYKTIPHYDEPLSVMLSGYKFGENQQVQASISHYDYPEKLGTTKINEELKYYDTVPINEE